MEKIYLEHMNAIVAELNKQDALLKDIKCSKAYRCLEGYHYLKNEFKNDKKGAVKKSIQHITTDKEDFISNINNLEQARKLGFAAKSEIGNMKTEIEDSIAKRKMESEEVMKLLMIIEHAIHEKYNMNCFMAPLELIDMPDGYSRRINNIDKLLSADTLRVYISADYGIVSDYPACRFASDQYVSVIYNPNSTEQCQWINLIATMIGVIYIHSIYQAFNVLDENKDIIKILDFHGVVPEELESMGKFEDAAIVNEREAVTIKNVNYIVVANEAMKEHILQKYPECSAEFVLIPMNNNDNDVKIEMRHAYAEDGSPVVIYSGGLQKWQLIDEMQDAICQRRDDFDYRIFVSNPEEFQKIWGERKVPRQMLIDTKTPEELKKEYEIADYGFVLRNDNIVNRVACPTKMIDYIKYRIVPIIKNPNIGDFQKKGLEYIWIDDFLEGKLPPRDEYDQMCDNNMEVLNKMMIDYEHGIQKLRQIWKNHKK